MRNEYREERDRVSDQVVRRRQAHQRKQEMDAEREHDEDERDVYEQYGVRVK